MEENKNNKEAYLSLSEAAAKSPYSQEYLSLRARQGKLRATKLGKTWFTTHAWLQEYLGSVSVANRHEYRPISTNIAPTFSWVRFAILSLILAGLVAVYRQTIVLGYQELRSATQVATNEFLSRMGSPVRIEERPLVFDGQVLGARETRGGEIGAEVGASLADTFDQVSGFSRSVVSYFDIDIEEKKKLRKRIGALEENPPTVQVVESVQTVPDTSTRFSVEQFERLTVRRLTVQDFLYSIGPVVFDRTLTVGDIVEFRSDLRVLGFTILQGAEINGDLTVFGNLIPGVSATSDIGSPIRRFRDLYLSGSVFSPGGTASFSSGSFDSLAVTTFDEGSVLFAGPGGLLSQDNPNFFWDDGNNRLGLGVSAPSARLHVLQNASVPALLVRQDGTGRLFDFQDSGTSVLYKDDGKPVTFFDPGVGGTQSDTAVGVRIVGAALNAGNNYTTTALLISGDADPAKPAFEVRTFRAGGAGGTLNTELVVSNGSYGSGLSSVLAYIDISRIIWNAESHDVDHIWRGVPDATLPIFQIDAGLGTAAFGGTPGNNGAQLEVYANTNPLTGASPLIPVLDTGLGGSVTVTGQTGNVYLNALRTRTLTASSATTLPFVTTLLAESPTVGANVTFTKAMAAYFTTNAAPHIGVLIQGASSQSGDLLRLENSSGTTLARFDGSGNLVTNTNTTLGDSSLDTVTFNASLASHLIPNSNNIYDLGSTAFFMRNVYTNTLVANNISAGGTNIAGTTAETFTLNSDNATADLEDSSYIFFRGTVTPNAIIRWNSSLDRIEANQDLRIKDETPTTGATQLIVTAGAGQGSTDLFVVENNAGSPFLKVTSSGHLLPGADDTYDLGSTALRWRDLYLGPTSLHVVSTAAETTTARDWKIAIQETDGASEGNLRLLEGANELVNITPGGNVGIGTTGPGKKLEVSTGASDDGIFLKNGGTSIAELFRDAAADNGRFVLRTAGTIGVDIKATGASYFNGGNVGIGTTGPGAKLHVFDATTTGSSLIVRKGGGAPTSGDVQLIDVDGVGSSAYNFIRAANTNSVFVVRGDGNVGIGTAGPDHKLHISDSGDNARLTLERTGAASAKYDIQVASNEFRIWNASGTDVIRFIIDANGNVGIGTTSPVAGGGLTIAPAARTSGSPTLLRLTGPADTTLANAEFNDVYLNLARTVTYTGSATAGAANITTQRAVFIDAPSYAFGSTGAQTITNASTVSIQGPPLGSTNATITNSSALRVETRALLGTTNGYGLYVDAPTGATNNYAATFATGNVGIGTTNPTAAKLQVAGTGQIEGALTVTTGGVAVTGNSTITGTLGGITTLTATTFSGDLSCTNCVANTELANSSITVTAGTGLLTGGTVALGGTVTVDIGTLTGLTAGADTLAVNYGSTANTAAQGSVTLTGGSAGTGLTGGSTIAVGAGGTFGALSVSYGSTAGTAAQGNVTLTGPAAGSGLTGGGGAIAVGAGGTFSTLNIGTGSCITVNADDIAVTSGCVNATTLDSLDSLAFLRAGAQSPAGNAEIAASDNVSTSYSVAALELRETNYGGTSGFLPPRLAFHWGGVVASQIAIESSGRIAIRDNPGTGYENLIANTITATTFSGDLSCTGCVANTELANSSITVTAGTGLLTGGTVALGGTVTVDIGTLTGLTAGADTLSVNYGSTANTSVQGNVTLTCPSGTSGLTGGGTVITLGSGGTCASISLASSSVGTGQLKTATGSVTGTTNADVTMNDFSFFPNTERETCSGTTGALMSFSVNAANDTVGRFRMGIDCIDSGSWAVRWRYVTASDRPTIWVIANSDGSMVTVWQSEDPVKPSEYPDNPNPFEGMPLSSGQRFVFVEPLNLTQLSALFNGLPETDPDKIITAFKDYVVEKRGWLTDLSSLSDLGKVSERYHPAARFWAMRYVASHYGIDPGQLIMELMRVDGDRLIVKPDVSALLSAYLARRAEIIASNVANNDASTIGADLAEWFTANSGSSLAEGELVTISEQGFISRTKEAYDARILGVVSITPYMVMGSKTGEDDFRLALSGRVSVKVTDENGPIAPGDVLTSSGTPGHAMKATKPGRAIGIALSGLSSGTGTVMVFVNPHWYSPDTQVQSAMSNEQLTVTSLTVTGTATFKGKATFEDAADFLGNVIASRDVEVRGKLTVRDAVTFEKNLTVKGDLIVEGNLNVAGKIAGSSSTRGKVTIPSGESQVVVTFPTSYATAPQVVATPRASLGGASFWVDGESETGFTVHLSAPTATPVEFTWIAIE